MERHRVLGRLAAAAVLRDIEQVDLIGGERGLERDDQLGGELLVRAGGGRRAGDAAERGRGDVCALA
jgi:hypothetical protein